MSTRSRAPRTALPLILAAAWTPLAGTAAAQPAAPAAPAEEVSRAEVLSTAAEVVAREEPAWSLSFDVRRLMDSPLAKSLSAAAEDAGGSERLDDLERRTGLNFREDVGAVVVSGDGFEDGSASLVADLGDAGGDLPAWLAEQPEHAVETLADGTELHRFRMEDKADVDTDAAGAPGAGGTTVWVALLKTQSGTRLVSADNEDGARRLAAADDLDERLAPAKLGGDRVLRFRAADLPEGLVPEGTMGGDVLGAIRGLTLALDSGEAAGLDLRLDTADAADAKRLQQTLQMYAGMVPMAGSAMGLTQDQGQQLFELVQQLEVTSEPAEGATLPGVRVRIAVPQEVVDGLVSGAREAAEQEAE